MLFAVQQMNESYRQNFEYWDPTLQAPYRTYRYTCVLNLVHSASKQPQETVPERCEGEAEPKTQKPNPICDDFRRRFRAQAGAPINTLTIEYTLRRD